MKILITGAAGFIGQLLAEVLLNDESYTVVLTDVILPPIPKGVKYPQNAIHMQADLCADTSTVINKTIDAAFVFHGIMSSGSEANFDIGMKVNFDSTRNLLEAFRAVRPGVRIIYASSQAVYGRPFPEIVDENVRPTPESSYGAAKLMCETLINDYTRRKFIDGIVLRFPTITVRPGKPTAAASSFLSGMIREPMNGKESIIPLRDRTFGSWVCSPRTLVLNLVHALKLDLTKVPPHVREINMPGMRVTIQEMMDALVKVAGKDALSLIKEKEDPVTEAIVRGWADQFDTKHAYALGFHPDGSFEEAVIDYQKSLE
ncbi:probable nucleoside-diphosphate-sugar epimerases [Rhynchosporium agropyri]|uniref:Probable nucleoside-diphosphate-sugar epimerases n=1 Tax=Rhynchosporium agropyri TaxID=914238 RepID=A0A1E1LTZ3_9HELO|nr:probable nucleoside-diphosphate-sugar epimerases [Rhynchosporium agropyri]